MSNFRSPGFSKRKNLKIDFVQCQYFAFDDVFQPHLSKSRLSRSKKTKNNKNKMALYHFQNTFILWRKQRHNNSQNWTFRQHRSSCHHQQCKQGSTQLKTFLVKSMLSKRSVFRFRVALFFYLSYFRPISYSKLSF